MGFHVWQNKRTDGFWIPFVITLFETSNFCPKIRFWQDFTFKTFFSRKIKVVNSYKGPIHQHFHMFFTQFFRRFFSWNHSCQHLKSAKFNNFASFSPKFFSGNNSWIFGQKLKTSNNVIIAYVRKQRVIFRIFHLISSWWHQHCCSALEGMVMKWPFPNFFGGKEP